MQLIFANLSGLWALLGIPIVILIHMLQHQIRKVPVSTLFLIEKLSPESVSGRRFDRLRQSIPFWMQILAVLLLTWLLVEPRWMRPESVQRIVVVLDSSLSMTAFEESLRERIEPQLQKVESSAATTHWHLLQTDTTRRTIYRGTKLYELLDAVEGWTPELGAHDFEPSLRIGQALLKENGRLIFITDHNRAFFSGVEVLSLGDKLDNVGWTGFRIVREKGVPAWRALVRNYSDLPQQRQWWLEAGTDHKTSPETVDLQPGQTITLAGPLNFNSVTASLVLEGDAFQLDDQLPFVVESPKTLLVHFDRGRPLDIVREKFFKSLPDLQPPLDASRADLLVTSLTTDHPADKWPQQPALIFLRNFKKSTSYMNGHIVAEEHSLMNRLNFQPLLARETKGFILSENDDVLLWQAQRPLLFLRSQSSGQQLVVNFDLAQSNAERIPAFVLLLFRYLETIRESKVGLEQRNVEIRQVFDLAADPDGNELLLRRNGKDDQTTELPPLNKQTITAPSRPGFFDIQQDRKPLLFAATSFADVREADLSEASPLDLDPEASKEIVEENSEADFLTPLWILLLVTCLFISWHYQARKLNTA